MKKESIKYSDIIYAFDIETTTADEITSIYLSSFVSVDFNVYKKDNDYILNQMTPATFCRSSEEINKYLEELNEEYKKRKEYVIIFCHNLAYEFDYLIKNIDFVKKNFNNNDALFIKPRIPLFIRVGALEFRCSYRLLNASLRSIGDNLGYQKLDINYNALYYPFSEVNSAIYQQYLDYGCTIANDGAFGILNTACNSANWASDAFAIDNIICSSDFTIQSVATDLTKTANETVLADGKIDHIPLYATIEMV